MTQNKPVTLNVLYDQQARQAPDYTNLDEKEQRAQMVSLEQGRELKPISRPASTEYRP